MSRKRGNPSGTGSGLGQGRLGSSRKCRARTVLFVVQNIGQAARPIRFENRLHGGKSEHEDRPEGRRDEAVEGSNNKKLECVMVYGDKEDERIDFSEEEGSAVSHTRDIDPGDMISAKDQAARLDRMLLCC